MPRRICSRHYPFSHRFFGLHYAWDWTLPSLSDFNAPTTVPVQKGQDSMTKLTDMILPGAPTMTFGEGTRTVLASYVLADTSPAAFPPGWSIPTFHTIQIELRYFRRTQVFFPSSITAPHSRPQRRSHIDGYYISARAAMVSGIIRAEAVFPNRYDISVGGYWGVNVKVNEGPASMSDYIETSVTPTIIECQDTCSYNEHPQSFDGTDWTLVTDSTSSGGTVPTAVSDYMNALKDSIKADLAAATIDAVWRSAALAGSLPAGVTNRTLLETNVIPQVLF